MTREIILYIRSNDETRDNSLIAALDANTYEVVSTDSSTEAVALLYIMHSVAAVVLDQQAMEQASFDIMRSLRTICPDVPIIVLCHDQIDGLSSTVDHYVTAGQPLEKLTWELRGFLEAKTKGCGRRASKSVPQPA
jgi:DNA-binding response OmpR family regulator